MDAKKFIEAHRAALTDAEAKGLTLIQTSTLHSIFDEMEGYLPSSTELHPLELEKFRSNLAGSLAYQEQVNTWNLEGFKQVIALGQSTLKSMMLINGGAAVALLAFLGNLLNTSSARAFLLPFANSLRFFVLGVFLAAVAHALTYLSQLFYACDKVWQKRVGLVLHVLTVLAGAGALLTFFCGASYAYGGFVAYAP